jgi:nitrate/nitrite transporter NarK|tara:strand:+ start:470 stop:949 length:480 start_codon:yes stop_codon:yes gene_type:complete
MSTVALPVLTGFVSRIFLGIWADQYGGRIVFVAVMVAAAIATFQLSFTNNYNSMLVAALGIFGVGNVGAAVTSFTTPFVLVAFGWEMVAQTWAVALMVTACIFWFVTDDDPEFRGACKCKLVEGEADTETDEGLSAEEKAEGYVLACLATPKTNVTISS